MRKLLCLSAGCAALLAALTIPSQGGAQELPRANPSPGHPSSIMRHEAPSLRDLSQDDLFEMLKVAPNEASAKPAESELLRRFRESDSDTIDLFMGWASRAMNGEEWGAALDVLDRVVILDPGFAEGWNKRATAHFAQKEYGKSIADIERTLQIEPRHFGALVGLGMILRELDEKDEAIAAFKAALAIHPQLTEAREALEELEKEQAGQEI
ncbi:tetratricopeptide repeat protein [Afifella sp. H1R]|uniref:tetratricopeptide repeat protein n=1 Tax=Afifella sp. H1R TaxID=2908841 RepID=UPI001F25905A|nr:tetratricopeptide repeat protein [Afifella sp. H1R]MCF1504066.1 tetratricopeptide repeat protein [Afifella sp. H1R]